MEKKSRNRRSGAERNPKCNCDISPGVICDKQMRSGI
jgi:hypothetical protein